MMLTEAEIIEELKAYKMYILAWEEGKRGSDLPKLPLKNEKAVLLRTVCGFFAFPILSLLFYLSYFLHLNSFAVWIARARIAVDDLSCCPGSCGLNWAYTKLGLAFLAKKEIKEAIQCLDASWRVHPCPHNSSFGLSRSLVSKLDNHPDALASVEQYIRIGRQFVDRPEYWVQRIEKKPNTARGGDRE